MAENKQPVNPSSEQQEPLIPPMFLLAIGFLGLLVAVFVAISQPEFGAVGYGGLFIAVIAFLAWALLSPQQAVAVFTGRTARFGGVSLIVTVVLLAAFVLVYIFARNAQVRVDLTTSSQFSLTAESRQAITAFGADPSVPRVRILAFYGAQQLSQHDQDEPLFQSYVSASNGKIDYQFIDPDRNPALAAQYGVTRGGELVVVADASGRTTEPSTSNASSAAATPEASATGTAEPSAVGTAEANATAEATAAVPTATAAPTSTPAPSPTPVPPLPPDSTGFSPDVAHAHLLQSLTQQDLTNAILRVAARGAFTAYFLTVRDSAETNMTTLKTTLQQAGGWTVNDTSLLAFTGPNPQYVLNDPNLDGEVFVMPGGTGTLSPDELQVLENYLNHGGDLVIFAGSSFDNTDLTTLATDPGLSDYLYTNFGIRVNNDVVLDDRQAANNALTPLVTDLTTTQQIMANLSSPVLLLDQTHSLSVNPTLPTNVTVTPIARTSDSSWVTTDLSAIVNNTYTPPADIVRGAQVVAAVSENSQTGARIVVFGTTSPALNTYSQYSNLANYRVAVNSLVWTTHFDDFARQITVQQQTDPSQLPLVVSEQNLRDINLLTLFVLPFGVLAIGAYVWWTNRERRKV